MRNPLQDQLLKAGLAKKHQVDAAVRAQTRQRDGKAPASPVAERVDARGLAAQKAERDRALAAERNEQLRVKEQQAQLRQLIEQQQLRSDGDGSYHFVDAGRVRRLPVGPTVRAQLARGALVIVRHGDGYALIPRAAAEGIAQRGGCIVVDQGRAQPAPAPPADSDEAYYARFQVPDDLIW
ncbi:MAG: DUF2058 domain-containing protein [Xanthomonadales bacterium]|nr:hypothetical protein [Xanthomonadales bacterium]MCC6592486.1 DUF2058 domain-containing protein [Xanthomonadales bacterium]MCE7930517.1 DUF2058 domain-containing protein [Xanthomonadales bacterium PRO6]